MTGRNAQLITNARRKLSRRYLAALRTHLGKQRPGNGNRAQALGRAVLAGGLVTLDQAVMHEKAIVALAASHDFDNRRNGSVQRAGSFFTQALIPLEAAQRAARETISHLHQRHEMLRRHTGALAAANRRLEREVARRKAGEVTIREGKEHYLKLLVESQVKQMKLRQLTHQMISAQEEDRKKISRKLHDEVVQTLVGINVELTALTKGTSAGLHALKTKIARTQRLVENSVDAVHRFARELRPAMPDDLGLIPALHAHVKGLAARKEIKIHLTAFGGVEALGNAERTVLYRVAQEALSDVARHAHATEVKISISRVPRAIRMEISDNGQSFHVEKTLSAKNPKRLGLVGMKERVEMVGGSLTIESTAGNGTTVRAVIPFPSEKSKI